MTEFTVEMDRLASQLAQDANGCEKSFGDRLDAFKVLMPYYALLLKQQGKTVEINDLPTFDNFSSRILASEHVDGEGEPGVRDRRRNGN